MQIRVQRQLIYKVMWNDNIISANIAPLSMTRHLSIWQFSHDSWRGASLQGRSQRVKNTMLTLSTLIGRNTDAIRGLVHRNMGRGLIGWLIKVSSAVSFHCKPSTVRQIGWFCSRLRALMATQGEKGTTLYLKSCQVLLQQSIAGYRVSDITELKCRVKRTKAGMPLMIPAGVRKRIREGDLQSLRLWMTLFGFYRICQFVGKLSLSTITDPGKAIKLEHMKDWESFLSSYFIPWLTQVINGGKRIKLQQPNPFPISKSSPTTIGEVRAEDKTVIEAANVSTSFYSLTNAAQIWVHSDLKPILASFTKKFALMGGKKFHPLMERIGWASRESWTFRSVSKRGILYTHKESLPVKSTGLGSLAKLGFKEEAAGKIRVFAMVDAFTQWVMKPIHDAIFELIKDLPTDGTFNQTKPVERLRELNPFNRYYFSIDLSAATDRLPISLQIPLMERVLEYCGLPLAAEAAKEWADLLVKREYSVNIPKDAKWELPTKEIYISGPFHSREEFPQEYLHSGSGQVLDDLTPWFKGGLEPYVKGTLWDNGIPLPGFRVRVVDLPKSVTYSVGQPMGALSSWAMLALTHHAIVQWAAMRARKRGFAIPVWFSEYAILGDDVVIANRHVANEYLNILRMIGVKAGLAKSIISKGQFYVEFAKKYFVPSGRADMLPFKECIAVYSSTLLTCEFVRLHGLNLTRILTFLGYGYRSKSRAYSALFKDLPRRLRTLLIWFRSPKGCFPLTPKEWLLSSGWSSRWDIPEDPTHMVWWFVFQSVKAECEFQLARYYRAADRYKRAIDRTGSIYREDEPLVGALSSHPPYLCEVTEVDPGTNSEFKSKLSYKHLIAPMDWEVHDEAKGGEELSWFLRLNMNYSHLSKSVDREPVTQLPQSLKDHDLGKRFMEINHSMDPYFIKVYKALEWLFSYDDVASEIPMDYWPAHRVADKPIREFLMVVKWHESFTRHFGDSRWDFNPRSTLDLKADSGNTSLDGSPDTKTTTNDVKWYYLDEQPCSPVTVGVSPKGVSYYYYGFARSLFGSSTTNNVYPQWLRIYHRVSRRLFNLACAGLLVCNGLVYLALWNWMWGTLLLYGLRVGNLT